MPGIHPAQELLGRSAAAEGIDAGEQKNDREVPGLEEVELGVDQPTAQLRLLGIEVRLVDLVR